MDSMVKICKKCLLDDLDEDEIISSIKGYIADYPIDNKVSSDIETITKMC